MPIITVSDNHKEVRFDKYCTACKFKALTAEDADFWDTCEPCLAEPTRQYSERPIKYEPSRRTQKEEKE